MYFSFACRPTNDQAIDLLLTSQSQYCFDGSLAHKSVGWKNIPDNPEPTGLSDQPGPDGRAVTFLSHQLDPHKVSFGKTIEKQSEWSSSHRTDEQVSCPIPIEVGSHNAARVGIEIHGRRKRCVDKRTAVVVDIGTVAFVGTQIDTLGRHEERVFDPELTRVRIHFTKGFMG